MLNIAEYFQHHYHHNDVRYPLRHEASARDKQTIFVAGRFSMSDSI